MPRPNTEGLPAGIHHAKDGIRYLVRITYLGQKYSLGRFETLGDAKAAKAIAMSEVARRTFKPPRQLRAENLARIAAEKADRVTVDEWIPQWLDGLQDQGRSPGTLAAYKSTCRVHISPALGDRPLKSITPDDVDQLTAGKTPSTTDNIIRTLSSMLHAAITSKAGGITESPINAPGAFAKRHRPDDADTATLEQVKALAAGMPDRLRASVWLAALLGLRLGECLGLQRRDLDLEDQDNAVLHVRRQWLMKTPGHPAYAPCKSGSERVLAIPASLVPTIAAHLDANVRDDPESPLFTARSNSRKPISQSSFDRHWRESRDKVKKGLHFHSLRHIALTLYAAQGATNEELLRRGGHSSLDIAMRYQSATADRDRTLTDRLDAEVQEVLEP